MKKSLLLLSSILSINFGITTFAAGVEMPAAAGVGADVSLASITVSVTEPISAGASGASAVATAADLLAIKQHIFGYGKKLGLPGKVTPVGGTGCFGCLNATFNAAEEFLLKELAGQVLARFLAIALDDFSDGRLDGCVFGKKVSYAAEIGALLGVTVSEEELKGAPVQQPLLIKLVGLGADISDVIIASQGTHEGVSAALGTFAKGKMDKARKSLAVALIREADRIISIELANGAIDGLDGDGRVIDYKAEMKTSVERALQQVLYGVL